MQPHLIRLPFAAVVTAIGFTLLLATGAAAETAAAPTSNTAAAATSNAAAKPTVVLVHGGFSDASAWDPVIAQLQSAGFPVIAPADPLRGPGSDSAYLASVLDTLSGPLILVGHSYGGIVISNAAAMTQNAQNVKALVYISAFIPDVGESGLDLTPLPGSLINSSTLLPRACPPASCPAGAEFYLDPAHFRDVMADDLPSQLTNVLAATQRGVSLAASAEKSQFAAWHTVPSFAMISTQDQAIGAANERVMAQRAQAHTVEVQAAHLVMLSHPGAVVSLIESAAGQH